MNNKFINIIFLLLITLFPFSVVGEETKQNISEENDKSSYSDSYNVDSPPIIKIDFDLYQYYPEEAKKANINSFTVTVLLKIDENGSLVSAEIASGNAPYGFNEQALKVVKRSQFIPGYKNGKPVKMSYYLPILFSLK